MSNNRRGLVGGLALTAVAGFGGAAKAVVANGPVIFYEGFENDTDGQIAVNAESNLVWSTQNPNTDSAGHYTQEAGQGLDGFGNVGASHGDLHNVPGNQYQGNYGTPGRHYYGFVSDPDQVNGFVQREDIYLDPATMNIGADNSDNPGTSIPQMWISQKSPDGNAYATYQLFGAAGGTQIDVDSQLGGGGHQSLGHVAVAGWYTLETAWVPDGGGNYNVVGTLYDSLGATFGTPQSGASGQPASGLDDAQQNDWYVFWKNGANNDVLSIDNYTVKLLGEVPEPASLGLLGLGSLLALRRKRKA